MSGQGGIVCASDGDVAGTKTPAMATKVIEINACQPLPQPAALGRVPSEGFVPAPLPAPIAVLHRKK
jgi:hypothetical protein